MKRDRSAYMRDYMRERYLERKPGHDALVDTVLRASGCVDCGESDPVVLEFDHVRGEKLCSPRSMVMYQLGAILAEIAKCEIRCANCHVRKTKRNKEHAGWRKRKPETLPLLEAMEAEA